MAWHNEVGKRGEEEAAIFLEQKGYKILERDHRSPMGQIDLIARDGETFVFVEVKTRSDGGYLTPEENLMRKQQKRIVRSAICWLKRLRGHHNARFDVVAVDRHEIRHHKAAFRAEGYTY